MRVGKVLHSRARREAFTPQEYRHLHTYARKWVNQAQNEEKKWYRTIVYNFILIMANTGMRTIEARNLRWRDVDARIDKQGRQFCCLNVARQEQVPRARRPAERRNVLRAHQGNQQGHETR